jgi:hypothetical protein
MLRAKFAKELFGAVVPQVLQEGFWFIALQNAT